jgi:hypothetical protein
MTLAAISSSRTPAANSASARSTSETISTGLPNRRRWRRR